MLASAILSLASLSPATTRWASQLFFGVQQRDLTDFAQVQAHGVVGDVVIQISLSDLCFLASAI
jgi:hypothetical protein